MLTWISHSAKAHHFMIHVVLLFTENFGSSEEILITVNSGRPSAKRKFYFQVFCQSYGSLDHSGPLVPGLVITGVYFLGSRKSKINDCRLERVGELTFDFQYGSCNSFNFETQQEGIYGTMIDQSGSAVSVP